MTGVGQPGGFDAVGVGGMEFSFSNDPLAMEPGDFKTNAVGLRGGEPDGLGVLAIFRMAGGERKAFQSYR